MSWLCDSNGQRLQSYRRVPMPLPRFTADQLAAMELVAGHVHPGNLGTLPPCPHILLYKAGQIGLL